MRVVASYHRSVDERCSSIRYRLQTRRDGLAEAYATDNDIARLCEVFELDDAMAPLLASPAREAAVLITAFVRPLDFG